MMSPSEQKSQQSRNALNARLTRSKSVTRKSRDGYEKESASIETDLPIDIDAVQGLEQLAATLETIIR